MALPPAPAGAEIEEGEIKQFVLILDELKITITPEGVIIESRGVKVADLSWREWRVLKTFLDNIYSELRAMARR